LGRSNELVTPLVNVGLKNEVFASEFRVHRASLPSNPEKQIL